MKKTACLLLAVILLALSACAKKSESVLNIAGADIDKEIYAYYLDKAVSVPDFKVTQDTGTKEYIEAAREKCVHYVACNTLFEKYGLKLTGNEKNEIVQRVNSLWVMGENHYNKVGVSRSALNKAVSAEYYENAIFTHLFDKGTQDKEAEKLIKEYFAKEYVVFRCVTAYFVTTDAAGEQIPMDEAGRNTLTKTFETAAKGVKDIESFEAAAKELQKSGGITGETVLLKKNTEGYPKGFFKKVSEIKNDTCAVLTFDDCVFLVLKFDVSQRETDYAGCRESCIKEMYADEAKAVFESEENTYKVKANDKLINEFTENIKIFG